MATNGAAGSGSDGDPLAAMKSIGRTPASTAQRPAVPNARPAPPPRSNRTANGQGGAKPTGAAAFVAREKAARAGRSGRTVGLLAAAGVAIVGAASIGAWAIGLSGPNTQPSPATTVADGGAAPAPGAAPGREPAPAAGGDADDAAQIAPSPDPGDDAATPFPPLPPEKAAQAAPLPGDTADASAAEADPAPDTVTGSIDSSAAPLNDGAGAPDGAETVVRTPVRVFIHVRAGDPDALMRAEAIADELRREGVEVAGIRGVPRAVRNDMVRFFYDADETAVSTLDRAIRNAAVGRRGSAPLTQDFRRRQIAPKPGTLEIWLS